MDTQQQQIAPPASIAERIVSNPHVCGGKPCIANTRIRVQDIYVWHELQGSAPEEIVADFPQLALADVHAALAFYFDNRDLIQRQMKDAEDFVARVRALTDEGPLKQKLRAAKNESNPISS